MLGHLTRFAIRVFSLFLLVSLFLPGSLLPATGQTAEFSLSTTSSSIGPIPVGLVVWTVITVTAINGFSGSVNLSPGVSPSNGLFPSLNSSTVNLSSAHSTGFANLTLTGTSPGSYSVNVTGTGISSSQSITLDVSISGVVCLSDPSYVAGLLPGSDPCPSSPYSFTGPPGVSSNSPQLHVGVYLFQSSPLNAFDIILSTDHTILKPAGVNLTGTVLPGGPLFSAVCLGGVPVSSSPCSPSAKNSDALELSATGAFGRVSPNPTTGLLFTAIYNITGTTLSSGISLGFQSGCGQSSVNNLCVTIANGTLVLVPEIAQTGVSFNNFSQSATPDFALSSNTASLGPLAIRVQDSSVMVNVIALNGFSDTVLLTVLVSPSAGLQASPSSYSVMGSGPITLTVLTFSAGIFAVNVTGTSGTLVHSVLIAVSVKTPTAPDFSIKLGSTSLRVIQSTSASSSVTLTGQNGFSGTIHLSAIVSPSTGLVASLGSSTVMGSGVIALTVSASLAGAYTVTVTGISGSVSHLAMIHVDVLTLAPSVSGSSSLFSPNVEFYSIVAVLLGVLGVGLFLGLRRRSVAV